MKLLEDLYSNAELTSVLRPASYWQELRGIGERRERSRNKLTAELNPSQIKLLEAYEEIMNEAGSIEDRYTFIIGFRLGVRMISECFAGDN